MAYAVTVLPDYALGALPRHTHAAVLWALATYANSRTGLCTVSAARLAERAGCSLSTVWRHLRALEAAGLVQRFGRARNGIRLSNCYRVMPRLLKHIQEFMAWRVRTIAHMFDMSSWHREPKSAKGKNPSTNPQTSPQPPNPPPDSPPDSPPDLTGGAVDVWRAAIRGILGLPKGVRAAR